MASFTGTWVVVSSPDFDEGYLRMEVDPYVILKQSGERVEGKYRQCLESCGFGFPAPWRASIVR
jgi:hypothetical protein